MATFVEGEAPETDSEDEQFSLSTVNVSYYINDIMTLNDWSNFCANFASRMVIKNTTT